MQNESQFITTFEPTRIKLFYIIINIILIKVIERYLVLCHFVFIRKVRTHVVVVDKFFLNK